MSDTLSQDEIDQLLNAMSAGGDATSISSSLDDGKTVTQRKMKIYDFKRPDKFSKEQIRTVSIMHETFARLTTTALTAQLRANVTVHVASVDQLTYEEFTRSIPSPTILGIVNMDPLKGSALLEIDPSISYCIVDRLFGGLGVSAKLTREMTEIEQSVMEGIIVRILGNLREAWSQVIDLRPRLGNIETNPQFAQIVPPSEMIMLVTLETKYGDAEGVMNFCIPYLTLEPIISKLSAQYMYSSVRSGGTTESLNIIKNRLDNIPVDVIAEVGSMDVRMKDVLSLKKGDIIRLPDVKFNDDIVLKIGTRDKFKCRPGVVGKKMSVQITGVVEKDEQKFEELEIVGE